MTDRYSNDPESAAFITECAETTQQALRDLAGGRWVKTAPQHRTQTLNGRFTYTGRSDIRLVVEAVLRTGGIHAGGKLQWETEP